MTVLLLAAALVAGGCAGMKPNPEYNRGRSGSSKSASAGGGSGTKKSAATPHSASQVQDPLAREVALWWGTPYRLGGDRPQQGVDCSAYVRSVFKTVYGVTLPRNSSAQYSVGIQVDRRSLRRGDLVFFNTSGRGVSHVGIYLGRGKFTHASNSDGVTIDDLASPYYSKRYIGAKRVTR